MKYFLLIICFGTWMLFAEGCKKHDNETIGFTYERVAGLWALYEYELPDGSVYNDLKDLSGMSIFGANHESLQLNRDQEFFPAQRNPNDNTLSVDLLGGGTYEYYPVNQRLKFNNAGRNLEYKIIRFNESELWLGNAGGILRLEKF